MIELTIGYEFNQEINIPLNIEKLKLDCNNINLIKNLLNSIVKLEFCYCFDLELNNLQNSIKILLFDKDSCYCKELNNLPYFLEKIFSPIEYDKGIKNINSQYIVITRKIEKYR